MCVCGDVWLSVLKAQIAFLCVNPFLSLFPHAPIRQLCLAAHRKAHIELTVCNYLQNDDWWSHMGKGMRTRDKSRQDDLGTMENFVRPKSGISPIHTHTQRLHSCIHHLLFVYISLISSSQIHMIHHIKRWATRRINITRIVQIICIFSSVTQNATSSGFTLQKIIMFFALGH